MHGLNDQSYLSLSPLSLLSFSHILKHMLLSCQIKLGEKMSSSAKKKSNETLSSLVATTPIENLIDAFEHVDRHCHHWRHQNLSLDGSFFSLIPSFKLQVQSLGALSE